MGILVSVGIPPKMFIFELLLALAVANFKASGLHMATMTALAPTPFACYNISCRVNIISKYYVFYSNRFCFVYSLIIFANDNSFCAL